MKLGGNFCLVLLSSCVAASCGGGSGGGTASTPTSPSTPTASAPAPAPTPTPAPAPTVVTGPYTFDFASGTSTTDQELIRSAIQFAHDFLQSTLGRTVEQQTTISGVMSAQGCSQGGGAAFTGARSITFCLANQGWTALGPITRQKVVIHELYHVLQFERRWLGNPAVAGANWIIEGAAEVIGYRGIASRNLLPYATASSCQVKEVFDFGTRQPPGLPNLSAVETQQQFQTTVGPLYALSMMGMDQLIAASSITALNTYGDAIAAGTPWQTAFQSAFGSSTTTFYAQFPAYRAGLSVPSSYVCGV
jgi:hypothetical protein